MFTKTFIIAAVLAPAVALSSAAGAQTYAGGPKAMFPVRVDTQRVETNKPYAQAVPANRPSGNKHIYLGGPKSNIPHGQR